MLLHTENRGIHMSNKKKTLIWKIAKVKHSIRIPVKIRTFSGVNNFRHTKKKKVFPLTTNLRREIQKKQLNPLSKLIFHSCSWRIPLLQIQGLSFQVTVYELGWHYIQIHIILQYTPLFHIFQNLYNGYYTACFLYNLLFFALHWVFEIVFCADVCLSSFGFATVYNIICGEFTLYYLLILLFTTLMLLPGLHIANNTVRNFLLVSPYALNRVFLNFAIGFTLPEYTNVDFQFNYLLTNLIPKTAIPILTPALCERLCCSMSLPTLNIAQFQDFLF